MVSSIFTPAEEAVQEKSAFKFLVYGDAGTGKTRFGLTFPNSVIIDSEDGYRAYLRKGSDLAKNVKGIVRTQSYSDVEKGIKELLRSKLKGIDTLIIDSETVIRENIEEALMTVEEARARKANRDELDANLSQRSWGKIKYIDNGLKNMKIRLSSKGGNILSIAQQKDETDDNGNATHRPNMKRKAGHDYDVVLHFFVEDGKFLAEVEKDRFEVFKKGEIIENPTFSMWGDKFDLDGQEHDLSYDEDVNKSKQAYEDNVAEQELDSKPLVEQLGARVKKLSKEDKTRFAKQIKEDFGIDAKELGKATKTQLEAVIDLLKAEY